MKKNLQKVLVLALGLTTTMVTAQDVSINSDTRINQDDKSANQRLTVGASWGGSDWGIHASSDLSYDVATGEVSNSYYEAYVSTDVMGFGTLTIGRQDLSFGSGTLISSNDWNITDRLTTSGADFSANFGGFDINVGTIGGIDHENNENYMNASGEFGGATFNVLMMNEGETSAHGYDLGYSLMGGDLSLSYSMNSDYSENEMTVMGASYQVFDNMSASYSMTSYEGTEGERFGSAYSNMNNGDWTNGTLGFQDNGSEVTAMGISYDLGGIDLGYTMYSISNGHTESDATSISLGYSLTDNASLSLTRMGGDDNEATWITISIRP